MADKQLNGSERVLVDGMASEEQCKELMELAKVSNRFLVLVCFFMNNILGVLYSMVLTILLEFLDNSWNLEIFFQGPGKLLKKQMISLNSWTTPGI